VIDVILLVLFSCDWRYSFSSVQLCLTLFFQFCSAVFL